MNLKIEHIEIFTPENVETNDDLKRENPDWNMDKVYIKTGVSSRPIAPEGVTALDLAEKACEKMFESHPELKDKLDGLVFCTQSGDYIMPPNSCVLQQRLGLGNSLLAFDFNLACSGYLYGLVICEGLLATGACNNILLVTADTYSRYIHKKDRSSRSLFGDGAAVSWLSTTQNEKEGMLRAICQTAGKDYDKFWIPAGGCRLPKSTETSTEKTDITGNVTTKEHIHMNGLQVLKFVGSKVPKQVKTLLKDLECHINDFDLIIFHQASKLALDTLQQQLKIEPAKVFRNIEHLGNTVSASIPMAIKAAQEQGRIKPGSKVLLCGFGVGLSWSSASIQF